MNRTRLSRKPIPKSEFSNPNMSERLIRPLSRFAEWRGGVGVLLLIFLVALLSRTVSLSSFPYFPVNWPWNGVNGLYMDENIISLLTPWNTVYWPFLQIALINVVINALGYSIFSIRLVSSLFSSITCVLVYLSALELFNRKLSALLSTLFFIFMTPALVLGRMAFLENGATTFFVATFLFAIKYLKTSKNRWLLGSAISAGLSFLCKQTGLAAGVFLILVVYIYKQKATHQLLKVLLAMGLMMSLYFLQILIVNPAYLGEYVNSITSVGIGNVSWLPMFLLNLLPSGVNVMWMESFLAPYKDLFSPVTLDFWYILAFFVIIYLITKERESVREVVLALASLVLVLFLIGHSNSYYVILAQPFMAIPFGYGVTKLKEMAALFSCFFSVLLCLPAAAYICYYLAYFVVGPTTSALFLVAQFVVVIPIVIALAIRFWHDRRRQEKHGFITRVIMIYYVAWIIIMICILIVFHANISTTSIQYVIATPVVIPGIVRLIYEKMDQREAICINKFLVVFYIICLLIGSYMLPVFYPGYFAQSSVPV